MDGEAIDDDDEFKADDVDNAPSRDRHDDDDEDDAAN